MRISVRVTCIILVFTVFVAGVLADEPDPSAAPVAPQKAIGSAQIVRSAPENKRIADIVFIETTIPVFLRPNDGRLRPLVEIHGRYNRPGWSLYIQKSQLTESSVRTEFTTFLYLNSNYSNIFFQPTVRLERFKVKKLRFLRQEPMSIA